MKKIEITEFATRQFFKNFNGTKILDMSPREFVQSIEFIKTLENGRKTSLFNPNALLWDIRQGDFEFSKLVTIYNHTNTKVSCAKITAENAQYIRSSYLSRTEGELPVLTRWLEFPPPVEAPVAEFLTLVLYSREQIEKEMVENEIDDTTFDAEYGIVAILAHDGLNPEPMTPITMMRNSLGIKEGGNGVAIEHEKYMQSVEFWKHHVLIK